MSSLIEINEPKKLYRVTGDKLSLWYDKEGQYTGLILETGIPAAGIPMEKDESLFRADGEVWLSCTDTPEQLKVWFSENDMKLLIGKGFVLKEVDVTRYRRIFFDGLQHEVYNEASKVAERVIDPNLIFGV